MEPLYEVLWVWCVVLCCTSRWIPVGLVSAGNSARRLSKVASLVMTDAGDCRCRGVALREQGGDSIKKAIVPAINEEAEMR